MAVMAWLMQLRVGVASSQHSRVGTPNSPTTPLPQTRATVIKLLNILLNFANPCLTTCRMFHTDIDNNDARPAKRSSSEECVHWLPSHCQARLTRLCPVTAPC